MNYLIVSIALIFILIILFNIYFITENCEKLNQSNIKKLNLIIKIIKIAPVIVLLIMLIVISAYLKTKFIVRLSHAWFVLQFWIFSTLFYVFSILIGNIKKSAKIFSIIVMILSAWIAIYLTPLPHYESLLNDVNIIILNILGLIMLGIVYFVTIVLQKKL